MFGSLGLFALVLLFEQSQLTTIDFYSLGILTLTGLMVFIATTLVNFGIKKIPASTTSILSLFEPLSAIVYGLLFFKEIPDINTFIGAGLILGAVVMLTKK